VSDQGYMTAPEAAAYLRFDDCKDPVHAFHEWARIHRVPRCRRGTRVLFRQRDLDQAVKPTGQPRSFLRSHRRVA
jgi:hypothetical protein